MPTSEQNVTYDIVAKLWNLCNILKDDGVTYHQYVIELTFLLFLKMAKETNTEGQIPKGYHWNDLKDATKNDGLIFYKKLLNDLGNDDSPLIKQVFENAQSHIKKSKTLFSLIDEIDKLDWYNIDREGLGDIYEGLLEKNASDKKSGAGQYFTPRPLIDSMVSVMRPTVDDVIQDPAAGTGGFLISANRYIQKPNKSKKWSTAQKRKYPRSTFYGMEFVQDTYRLALMNLMLHGLGYDPKASGIHYGDTLSPDINKLPKATLILTNPPFGSKKGGGLPDRKDFSFVTSNKQFAFLQHVYSWLKPGGRAAVVFPDNVLSGDNTGKQIRADLMEKCNLHTILRLPTGIFYAQSVKTNVLFFTRGKSDKGHTKEVWIYDMRANMPVFGKRTGLTRDHFKKFEDAFGNDPLGKPASLKKRKDNGEGGRFRRFTREWIAERDDNLNIAWLKDENEELSEPETLAEEALGELEAAMAELRNLLVELGQD